MNITSYAILHGPTGYYMPLFRNNRGYSNWTPGGKNENAMQTVRLFPTERAAKIAAIMWAKGVFKTAFRQRLIGLSGYDEFYDQTIEPVPGRRRGDLVVVTMTLKPIQEKALK